MAYKSQTPSPLYLKKPTLLVSPFSRVGSATLPNSPLHVSTPTSSHFSPQVLRKSAHSRTTSAQFEKPHLQRPTTKAQNANNNTFDGAPEDGDKKAAIKFGKAMQLNKVTLEDKKEESRERYLMARKYLQSLKEIRIFEDTEGRLHNKKKMLDESEKAIKLADSVFGIMNIRIKEMNEMLNDSAMTIYPIEERQELAHFYQMLVPEVCNFPYALLVKLKIFLLTICSEASLYSPSYNNLLEQKMRNGLVVLRDLQEPEAVRDYWYKVVACHFIRADPVMYEQWKEFVRNENAFLPLKRAELKTELEELILTLRCVINPEEVEKIGLPQIQPKMKFVRQHLKNFEPICFDEGWWDIKYNNEFHRK